MAYNGPMQFFELTEALSEVPGVEVGVRRGLVSVHIPALGDTARLDPDEISAAEPVFVPTRLPAVQLDVRRGHEILPLIVTVDDLVFTPAYADDLVEKGAYRRLPAMPNLISYSEMHRDVRALGKAIDDATVDLEPEVLAATLLAHRCFLAGAMRVGLWPVRVAAWWEYANARVGGPVGVAPLRADPDWDDLMADVTEARRQTAEQSERSTGHATANGWTASTGTSSSGTGSSGTGSSETGSSGTGSSETGSSGASSSETGSSETGSSETASSGTGSTEKVVNGGNSADGGSAGQSARPGLPQQVTRFRISDGSLQPISADDQP